MFQHLTAKDGLASDQAKCIFQDSKGYYWVGTDNDLQRFDGKSFIDVLADAQKNNNYAPTSLSAPLLEDKEGNIWRNNGGSISIYYPLTGRKEILKIHDDTTYGISSNIQYFCKDEWSNIWITTNLNLYKYDYKVHKPILWLHLFADTDTRYYTKPIYDKTKKGLWFAGGPEILFADIKTRRISRPFINSPSLKFVQYPLGFLIDSKRNLWFSDWTDHIYKYNTVTFKTNVYSAYLINKKNKASGKSLPWCFCEDTNGKIWVGSTNGFFYYNEKQDTIVPVSVNNTIPYSKRYEQEILDMCSDNEGNILACTDKGISILSHTFGQFTTIDENNLVNSFPYVSSTRLYETSSGDILAGTWGNGWFIYDKNFKLKKLLFNSHPRTEWNVYKKNMVWCFAEDHKGKIWIGYQYGLVGIFDTTTQHIQFLNPPEFEKRTIRAIACDEKGNIWFGLHAPGFLSKWDAAKHNFFMYKPLPLSHLQNASVSGILINKQNEIWVATDGNGFYRFDPVQEKVVEAYSFKRQDSTYDFVNSLTQINDSVIGVSTASNGVLLFNEKTKAFTSVTMQDGLPVNDVYGLAQDKQNNLWIATTSGLLRMNAKTKKIISFDEENGLLAKNFDYNIVSLRDGRMAVPTSTGIVYFSPDDINTLPAPPDVRFTNFKVFDKVLLIDSILAGNKTIELDHTQNFITIGYASLSFLGRNTMQYSYQLQGVDKDWVAAGTQRFASYTNLSPGHYTFKVQCENQDGIHSKNITTLHIYIHHPWWFSWWAYCLYALFAVGIIFSLYRNRINQLEGKQAAQIKAMVATQEEERKRISRDIHDDIGTKLSALNLFLSSLHEKAFKTNNEEISSLAKSAEQFIKEAMQDVRQLLLNLSPTVLEEFGYTTAVEGLVNKINETKQIHFSLVVFGMHHRLQKDYELALYRITQELINNVLKHAEAKHVSLQIGVRDEKLILLMEDDGKGFDVTAHKDGYGLHNLDARAKLMHGTIAIDSRIGNGTSVLIEIPYNLN